ncbi:MAG: transposase [Armatimonadetes bacterium]|nr:transposase [Armatimonadota bacterium]
MASYVCLYYHIVFGTKGRARSIGPEARPRLWDYIGGIVRSQGGVPYAIGGAADHVHILANLPKDRTIPDVLREVKGGSSQWMHSTFPDVPFTWQEGYGAFTVSVRGLGQVTAYIARQEEHHREVTFEEEFRSFLNEHGVEYDERYLWGTNRRPYGA